MPAQPVSVRLARTEELERILEMIGSARAFLAAQGLDQWQDGYPQREILQNDIDNHQLYVVIARGEIAACFVLLLSEEPTYARIDGAWGSDAPYGTIHRLAVCERFRRMGVGGAIFEYCESVCRAQSMRALRVDTHPGNRPMRALIEKSGFSYRGVIYLATGAPRVAYDKTL